MKPTHRISFLLLQTSAALALLANQATALTITWNGAAGVPGNWSAANWGSGTPVAGDLLQFGGVTTTTTNNDLTADTSFLGIDLTNNGTAGTQDQSFTLAGARITLGGNITTTAVTGTALSDTISLAMVLDANRTITAATSHNLAISGVISETGGARTLTKAGAATLTLSGNNTFSGNVTWVNTGGGTIVANNNNALGSGTVAINGNGSALQLVNGITVSNAMTVGANGNAKILRLADGATSGTYAGNIVNSEEVGSNFDLNAGTGGTLTVSGIISSGVAAAGMDKQGAGTVTLTAANTYTGTTTVGAGTLSLGNGGTTGRLTATSSIVISTGANLTINRSNAFSQATDLGAGVLISGAGGFTQAGAGTTTLTAANTYTGTTTIKNGTLALDGAANRLATTGAVVLGDTGTTGKLVLGGTTTASQQFGSLTTTGLGGSVVGGNAANSVITVLTAGSVTFDGMLGGLGTNENNLGFTKSGNGTVTLSNTASTFVGQITVNAGTLAVTKLANNNAASSIGSHGFTIRLGATSGSTGTLSYTGTTDASTNKQIQIGNVTAGTNGNGSVVNNSVSGKLTFTGTNFNTAWADITAARALTLGGSYTGAANEITGVIQDNDTATGGTISLTKTGDSTWQLSGANTYTGASTITTGTLKLASTGSIATSTSVTIGAPGNLDTTAKATYTISGAQPLALGIDATGSGSSGKIVAAGLNISSAVVTYNITGTPDDPVYVLATYTSLTGTFATVPAPPTGYTLDYAYQGNKIALVLPASNNYASWADDNGIPGEPASGDFENDGITNIVEYALGTSPTVSTQPAGVLSGNVITFTKGAAAIANGDVSWVIETSQTLAAASWTAVVTQPAADPALTISYTLTPSTPEKNFARLKVIQTP